MQRRQFLGWMTATSAALWRWPGPAWSAEYDELEQAWAAAPFDPRDAHSAILVVAADSHYGAADPPEMRPLVEQVNAIRPRPAMLCVNGDLVHTASLHFGHRPDAQQQATAIEEFKAFKRDADRLEVPLVLTLGNHDIAPGEVEPELFWQVFDQAEHPAYQVRQVGGMPCFFLNGRHNGDIDPAQRQWLVEQAAAIDRDQEALLFVHQPALGAVVNERGIAPAIREAFAEHAGPLWLVAGHAHHNGDRVFALPRTTIVQASITTVGPGMWGGPERPGYWLYGLHGGRVAARVYRQLNGRYRVVGPPSRADAQAITEPFEHVQPRWKVLVGEGDRQWLVEHEASDVETYWFYVGKLHYRLPLGEAEGARRLALLARLGPADNEDRARVLLSGDGDDWQAMAIGQPRHGVYTWELPPELRAGRWLHVRLDAPNRWRSQAVVAGFALLG